MNPKVLLIGELGQYGIGYAAEADLNGIAVLDEAGHVLPDRLCDCHV